jgi:hypothetical protein
MSAIAHPWLTRSRKPMISFAYSMLVPFTLVHIAHATSYHPTQRNDKQVRNRSNTPDSLLHYTCAPLV